MKIKLLAIGKTNDKNLIQLIATYQNRLQHYLPFDIEIIPSVKKNKNSSENQQKKEEGMLFLKRFAKSDQVILLDEKGKQHTSVEFSHFLQKKMNSGCKTLVFCIGGPYGFSDEMYQRANGKLSLSKMTFSHQMVRLFFIEQLYRGFSILKGEPYHHE